MARKYFGTENPLGQSLEFRNAPYEVTGVIKDVPHNTHYHFDLLASFSSLRERLGANINNWGWGVTYTYVLLEEGMTVDKVQALMPQFGEKYLGEPGAGTDNFQPITSIHLYSQLEKEVEPGGNIQYIYLLSIIAAFVLVVAGINFINLTTARATDRAKEIGVRKTVGAQRGQLIRQLLGESLLISLMALILAVLLIEAVLPLFNSIAGKHLSVRYAENVLALGGFLGLSFIVGLVAGSYPAFILSRFRPVTVLKGSAMPGSAGARLRKALVVFQFAISTFLFIGAAIVYQQLQYMQNTDLGFSKEQVIVARTDNYPVLKESLLGLSEVSSVTAAWHAPGERIGFYAVQAEGMSDDSLISMRSLPVDFDYLETMQIDVVAGRSFSETMATDADQAFMLNQAAVDYFAETYGWTDPLGKTLTWAAPGVQRQGEIIGVVRDFNFASLHTDIEPLILLIWPAHSRVFIRANREEWPASLAAIRAVWQDVSPTLPFDFFFVDDQLNQLYRAEQRLSRVFGAFTSIALFIACLGLFGLAAFMAAKRKKEIGIRKVFGATSGKIVLLFSRDFAVLVLIAVVVALPLAYLAVDRWLAEFAYHVAISWWVFLVAALAALAIALIAVSYQSVKAAMTNPVEALKYE